MDKIKIIDFKNDFYSSTFKKNYLTDPIYNKKINNVVDSTKSETQVMDLSLSNKSHYSNTNYSDADNIYVHKICKIMVDLQNDLIKYGQKKENNIDYYKIYTQYCIGLKLEDIGGSIEPTEENIQKIQQIINEMQLNEDAESVLNSLNEVLVDKNGNEKYKLDVKGMKVGSFLVNEIVSEQSGYDATVLTDLDGNYVIVNSSTNDKQIEDLAIIADAISNQLFPNQDFAEKILEMLVANTDFSNQINQKIEKDYLKKCRNAQIWDNKKLITKIAMKAKEEGKKIELYGYSLGGGIQLTAYSEMVNSFKYVPKVSLIPNDFDNKIINNKIITDNISSVTVYNPFVSVVEQSYNGNQLINCLCKSEKVLIYSAEEDYVSIFNNSVEKLVNNGRMIFIPSVDLANPLRQLNDQELSSLSDEDKNKILDKKYKPVDGLNDFMGLIIGSIGNHGFKYIENNNNYDEDSCFDNNGNLVREGEFKSLSDSLYDAMNGEWGKTEKNINYNVEYDKIIEYLFNLSDIESNLNGVQKKSVGIIFDYIKNNACNYNYDDFISAISDAIWVIVTDEIDKQNFAIKPIANCFKDKNVFDKTLSSFLNDEDCKNSILQLIYYLVILNSNKKSDINVEEYNTLVSNANGKIELLIKEFDNYYSLYIVKNYSFGDTGLIKDFVNYAIKDKIIKQFKSALKGIVPLKK